MGEGFADQGDGHKARNAAPSNNPLTFLLHLLTFFMSLKNETQFYKIDLDNWLLPI